jgi:toxin-antitoxin system PIN domain toxin
VIVVDVNLLVYAVVDGFREHDRARLWWEQTLSGSDAVGLAVPVIFGFLRVTTSSRVLAEPIPVADAVERVREWLGRPNVHLLASSERHLRVALDLLDELGTAGNLTTDVQIAAHAIIEDGVVYSNDSDFGRLASVRSRNPLRAQ